MMMRRVTKPLNIIVGMMLKVQLGVWERNENNCWMKAFPCRDMQCFERFVNVRSSWVLDVAVGSET